MKPLQTIIITGLYLVVSSKTSHAQTANEIMEKHVQSVGGVQNWDKVKTLKLTGTLSQQGFDIGITQTMEVGKAMRMDVSMMGMSGYQIVTQNGGWMYMPFQGSDNIDTLKPELADALRRQMDVKSHQLLDYKEKGVTAEYNGTDTIAGAMCYKVKLTDKDGAQSVSYFDKATYYLLKTESKIKQNDQETDVTIVYNNYKKFDEGITMPMSVTAQGVDINFTAIEINKPVDESIFIPSVIKK